MRYLQDTQGDTDAILSCYPCHTHAGIGRNAQEYDVVNLSRLLVAATSAGAHSPCGLSPPDCACERPSHLSRPTTPLATANCIPASMGLRLWPSPPASSLRHRRCFSPMETVPAPAFGVAIPHLLPLCRRHRPPLVFSLTRRAGWRIQASSVGSGEFQVSCFAFDSNQF